MILLTRLTTVTVQSLLQLSGKSTGRDNSLHQIELCVLILILHRSYSRSYFLSVSVCAHVHSCTHVYRCIHPCRYVWVCSSQKLIMTLVSFVILPSVCLHLILILETESLTGLRAQGLARLACLCFLALGLQACRAPCPSVLYAPPYSS